MGLFSIFKKTSAAPTALDPPSAAENSRLDANSELARQNTQALQRDIARATAMKIDAIESAMAFDIFNTPEPAWGSRPPRPAKPADPAAAATPAEAAGADAAPDTQTGHGDDDPATLPLIDDVTTELLGEEDLPLSAVEAESAPMVEEIAVLYASGEHAAAEQMLVASLPACGGQDRTVWWMLFDLYQISGRQDAFDNLSIDYASCFETSPPAWNAAAAAAAAEPAAASYSGVTPTEAFSGVLDGAIAPQLERLRQQAASNPVLRLEFNRVTSVEPDGCALLLTALQALQQQQRELIVVAAAELAEQIRAIIAVGRRDEGAAPWLLLLELLQLLNREKDFEETGMDYCVTFEMSPPSFVAPHKVATAARQHVSASPDRFMLPAVIEGPLDTLLAAVTGYAEQYPAVVFDCSRLGRLEFGPAHQLLARLQTLANGRKVEFRDVNHLVAALLRLLGYAELARIYPHNY